MDFIIQSLYTVIGLFWKSFWALAIGYAFSAIIQVFISHKAAVEKFWKWTVKQLFLASLLWFISSSCSFAALSSTRALFIKWASLVSSLAFMFASTNLAIEVAALAYIFLGWQYALWLFVWAPILIMIQALLVRMTYPKKLVNYAIEHAKNIWWNTMDYSDESNKSFKQKFFDKNIWYKVWWAYKAEWLMVYKEIFIGFLIAGFVATMVPKSFFEVIFPTDLPIYILLPLQAFMAPIIAIITVIWSMGNWPLAAILANNGILFWAIMAFLYADFNVPPAIKINANYYWWKFSLYIAFVTASSAILTGIIVHLIFFLLNILPKWVKNLSELVTFQFDYTFYLNIFAFIIAIFLFFLSKKYKNVHMHW